MSSDSYIIERIEQRRQAKGFYIIERTEKRDGVVTKYESETRCTECNGQLHSSEDWSRHQRIHTPISDFTAQCFIPQSVPKGAKS